MAHLASNVIFYLDPYWKQTDTHKESWIIDQAEETDIFQEFKDYGIELGPQKSFINGNIGVLQEFTKEV